MTARNGKAKGFGLSTVCKAILGGLQGDFASFHTLRTNGWLVRSCFRSHPSFDTLRTNGWLAPARGALPRPFVVSLSNQHERANASPHPLASFDKLRTNGWLVPAHAPSTGSGRTEDSAPARGALPRPFVVSLSNQPNGPTQAPIRSHPSTSSGRTGGWFPLMPPFPARSWSPPSPVRGELVEPHERANASPHPFASFRQAGRTPLMPPSPARSW